MPRVVPDEVPELDLHGDICSDTETLNTDRSTGKATSTSVASSDSGVTGDMRKPPRKSLGRNNMKRTQPKIGNQQKNFGAVAQLKGKQKLGEPRLMRTPSSSSESVAFSSARSSSRTTGKPAANAAVDTPHPLTKKLIAHGNTIKHFRDRKSISAMDFKEHVKLTGTSSSSSPSAKSVIMSACKRHEVTTTTTHVSRFHAGSGKVGGGGCGGGGSGSQVVKKLFEEREQFYVVGRDTKMAEMRIFGTIMLNAWRKRRNQVKTLADEIACLKAALSKSKSQVYMCRALFQVQKKHNVTLLDQLKDVGEQLKTARESVDLLEQSLQELRGENNGLEEKLQRKEEEFDRLSVELTGIKAELFQAMACKRDLQVQLAEEERKSQALQIEKEALAADLMTMEASYQCKLSELGLALAEKNAELTNANEAIDQLNVALNALKNTDLKLQGYEKIEQLLKKEIATLQTEIVELRHRLDSSLAGRLKFVWRHILGVHHASWQVVCWVGHVLMPAVPPPKITPPIPYGMTMTKTLNLMKS